MPGQTPRPEFLRIIETIRFPGDGGQDFFSPLQQIQCLPSVCFQRVQAQRKKAFPPVRGHKRQELFIRHHSLHPVEEFFGKLIIHTITIIHYYSRLI